MDEAQLADLLALRQAVIRETHVVYASGRHGDAYVNKDVLFLRPTDVIDISIEMAKKAVEQGIDADVVLGPTVGGALLAQDVAFELGERLGHEVLSVYADKAESGDERILKRGYNKVVTGKRCLIVDDVVTTGGSVKKTKDAVERAGGIVIGIIVICNRGGVTAEDLGVEWFLSLLRVDMMSYAPDECPLCKGGIPINVEVGHGAKFLAEKDKG